MEELVKQLKEKLAEIKEVNKKLWKTGNEDEYLMHRVSELISEEYAIRYKCAEAGIEHWNIQ